MNYGASPFSLPDEVWHECFAYLRTESHKNLSLSCHLFNDICRRFLFRSIFYSARVMYNQLEGHWTEQQLATLSDTTARLQALSKSPQHASVVRKCTISFLLAVGSKSDRALADSGRQARSAFVETFVECLPRFVNLKKVDIVQFVPKMDKRMLLALARHSSLDEVSFDTVRFGASCLKPYIKPSRLSISDSRWGDPSGSTKPLNLFSGRKLEYLNIWMTEYTPKLFRALSKQGILHHLRHLSFCVNPADISYFYLFLPSCPNLEHLRVGFRDENGVRSFLMLDPLEVTAIPRLESFSGPASAAKILVPGRPVRGVRLELLGYAIKESGNEVHSLLNSLAESTGPVTKLDVSPLTCTTEILDLVVQRFPSLQELHFSIPGRRMIPGDPQGIRLDTVTAQYEEDVLSRWDTPSCLPNYHRKYMDVLHWIAHKRLELPTGIKIIRLLDDSIFDESDSSDGVSSFGYDYSPIRASRDDSDTDGSSSTDNDANIVPYRSSIQVLPSISAGRPSRRHKAYFKDSSTSANTSTEDSEADTSDDDDVSGVHCQNSIQVLPSIRLRRHTCGDDADYEVSEDHNSGQSSDNSEEDTSDVDDTPAMPYRSSITFGPPIRRRRPYSLKTVQAVFQTLSAHYPALERVTVGDRRHDELLRWGKLRSGRWVHSLCQIE